jgi:hypothetical protein
MHLPYPYPQRGNCSGTQQIFPISLCNVIYKIISKVIPSDSSPFLPSLVSPEQCGYVEGHQILDSILLAHEVAHSLKTTKTLGMLIKLDMSKAFDKIS